jgi:pimeloyl-ACP methyl ester carboxylesterase
VKRSSTPIGSWHYLGARVTGTVIGMETTPHPTTIEPATTRPRPERLSPPGPETRRTVVDGVTFVHQRFRGATPSGPPAVLLQHFPAESGAWDPMTPPRTSDGREIILMEHWDAGVEADTDEAELDRLARGCLDFIDALRLAEADLLGFSLGVRPPDDVVLLSPRLVERLVSTSHHAR